VTELRFIRDIPKSLGEGDVFLIRGNGKSFPETAISEAEEMRAEGMSSEWSRKAFLAGRRIVRQVLAGMLSLTPESVPIILEEHGRPVVEGGRGPCFSISHSGGSVMVVFSGAAVGLDVEEERPVEKVALARRFFSSAEAELVRESPSIFFPLWTSREAAIKADGRGMARLLGNMSAIPSSSGFTVRIGEETWESVTLSKEGPHLSLAMRCLPELILWSDPLQLLR
jgi:4'-phosphopantetheinyl transferase